MNLMHYLPPLVYHEEPHVKIYQDAVGKVMQKLREDYDDFFLQLKLSTVTWGVSFFERDYGILPDPDKTTAQRVALVRAKRRGRGTTTKAVIKAVAESFFGGEVDIIEHTGDYWFEVKPLGDVGDIVGRYDLIKSIEEIKPAHLGVGYKFKTMLMGNKLRFTGYTPSGFTCIGDIEAHRKRSVKTATRLFVFENKSRWIGDLEPYRKRLVRQSSRVFLLASGMTLVGDWAFHKKNAITCGLASRMARSRKTRIGDG